jgi:diadenosine tetraphosphate (Ap4A) HIT family hydrolase
MFELDPRLAADTIPVGRFALCRVLLMNDRHYPWLVLVPPREGVTEIYQLDEADRLQFARESAYVASRMAAAFGADKMNVAALGNVVAQLHVHHIARFRTDAAWPRPVWGVRPAKPYDAEERHRVLGVLHGALTEGIVFDEETTL